MRGSWGGGGEVVQTSPLKIFNLPIIDLRTPHSWNHNYPLAPLPPLHDPHMSTDNSMKKKNSWLECYMDSIWWVLNKIKELP